MKLMIDCRLLGVVALLFLGTLPCLAQETVKAVPPDGVLSVDRAWDYRPYRVRVWICTDGSPEINANFDRLVGGLKRRSELADPSGWELLVSRAPNPWAFRLPGMIAEAEKHDEVKSLSELVFD
ncbi:hypothetical protein OAG68_01940, partial [bacterium]|nr:hypothetical protein [bacterium]